MFSKRSRISLFFSLSLLFLSSAFLALSLSALKREFALSINGGIGAILRVSLVPVSNFFGIFLFETLIVTLPFTLFFSVLYILRAKSARQTARRFLNLLSFPMIFLSLYILTLGVGYNAAPSVKLNVGKEEYKGALEVLVAELSLKEAEYIGENEAAERLFLAYGELNSPRIARSVRAPRPKEMRASALASDMRILASYSFLTAEISVNKEAPSYMTGFSIAHEMAHLFGISSEEEANFYAYLSCMKSNDSALMYSACLNAFEYIGAELYRISPEEYFAIYESLPETVKCDMESYNEFYNSQNEYMAGVSNKVNKGVLKLWDKVGTGNKNGFAELVADYILDNLSSQDRCNENADSVFVFLCY